MKKFACCFMYIAGAIAIAVASAGITYYFTANRVEAPHVDQPAPPTTQEPTSTPEQFAVEPGVTWLSSPQKLGDLKLYIFDTNDPNYPNFKDNPIVYYKIGTDNNKDVIIAAMPAQDPSGDFLVYFLKNSDTSYDLLYKMGSPYNFDDKDVFQYGGGTLAPIVKLNKEKQYLSITSPAYLAYTVPLDKVGDEYIDGMQTPVTSRTTPLLKEVKTFSYGSLFTSISDGGVDGIIHQVYVLKKRNGVLQQYQYTPSYYNSVGHITAQLGGTDMQYDTDRYSYLNTEMCGTGWYESTFAEGKVPSLKDVGTIDWGGIGGYDHHDTVYEITDSNNALLKYLYQYTLDEKKKNLSYEQFLTKHPLLVIKDGLGRYLLLQNMTYGPLGEGCGKPVIYLYPTTTTPVSVKVGASIDISDPAYNDGWNVVAQPNGTLTNTDGKKYDSLFWEGLGNGYYPAINRGFVVAHNDLEKTIRAQLATLGLNEKETGDFLAFWLPRLPKTPYVRLSWLTTKNMDTLAPLTVYPKPDTTLRVFLDFKGLDQPITIQPQVLTPTVRKGFTLVEWGGLLKNDQRVVK